MRRQTKPSDIHLILYMMMYFNDHTKRKLEQLERLRSEDTPATPWLPTLLSHIGSQVKIRQSQSYKFKEFAKISNCWILKQSFHATYLLKLLHKMCKYEMDPTSIVEDTERTPFCPQTDKVKPAYPSFNFVEAGRITRMWIKRTMHKPDPWQIYASIISHLFNPIHSDLDLKQ